MIHFRLDEWSPAYYLYLDAITYPIKVSEGHLLNLRILKPPPDQAPPPPPYNIPLLECLLYASTHFHASLKSYRPAYDIFWGQQYLEYNSSADVAKIAQGFDLLCDIQVRGGTYAIMGEKKFSWDSDIHRWILPELTQINPLYILGKEGVLIDTDGHAIYAKMGIIGNDKLRSKINRIANNQYSHGETWY